MRTALVLFGFVVFLPTLATRAAPGSGSPDGARSGESAVEASGPSSVVPGSAASAGSDRVAVDSASVEWKVSAALEALGPAVVLQSHPLALRTALHAYYEFVAANPERVRNPYFYFVDFGLDNLTPRGYVFDMASLTVVDGPFMVSHGRGSLAGDGVPRRFSNQPGSYATSLGLYVTRETYTFRGKASGRPYTSVGLRLEGVSGPFNDNALGRRIVVHGAPYVTPKRAGLSEGCPAMEEARARRLLPLLANGGLVFHFSPNDERWFAHATAGIGPLAAD